jgi:hypothetical protein
MRYFVAIRDDYDDWEDLGSVLLPPGADPLDVEAALTVLGV